MASITVRSCILCGSDTAVTRIGEVPGYSILFCGTCRLRFSDPMAHPGQDFYQESQLYDNRAMGRVSLTLPQLEWRYRTFLGKTRPLTGRRFLDLGCGDGGFLEMAAEAGADPFGLELDSRGVEIARRVRGLRKVEQGRFEKVSELGWRDFDYITCMEVLEHVSDPCGLAAFIHGLLKPGGLTGISVPSWDRRPAIFDPETDFPPHHFTLWTREALMALLRKAGFEAIEVLEAPVTLQNFLYAAQGRFKSKARKAQPPERRDSVRPEQPDAGIRVDRSRVRMKAALYRAFNLVNPVLGSLPGLRGYTLLAIGRKPKV
jgi:2-polyprenyl-3-methyl-5-hydroxy-6-metoxy-1,4-benzoquinol methylase